MRFQFIVLMLVIVVPNFLMTNYGGGVSFL